MRDMALEFFEQFIKQLQKEKGKLPRDLQITLHEVRKYITDHTGKS